MNLNQTELNLCREADLMGCDPEALVDLKDVQIDTTRPVAQRMEAFLTRIPLEKSQIVLIGPPRMKPGAWITDDRLLEDCVRLNAAYRTVAEKLGVRFVDATGWDIDVTYDGVHYSEKGHQTFAEQLFLSLSRSLEVNT